MCTLYSEKYGTSRSGTNYISRGHLVTAAKYYFRKHISNHDERAKKLTKEFIAWLDDPRFFEVLEDVDLRWDRFWRMMEDEAQELPTFAMFLLSICPQSATCERLFKELALQHTKSRNHMRNETALMLSNVKQDVLRANESSDKKKKNRIVSAEERPKRGVNQPRHVRVEITLHEEEEEVVEIEVEAQDETKIDEEEEFEEVVLEEGSVSVVSLWAQALGVEVDPYRDDGDVLFEEYENSSADEENDDQYQDGIHRDTDIPPQQLPYEQLDPLPDYNDKKYPQEKLENLKCPRSHKITLKHLFDNDLDLPNLFHGHGDTLETTIQ